ncbi:Trans-hexaprenyltranstransferase [Hirschia baltica ATCC 49814]|uniref:Trans-hexaprenyltranstransferase n=2 Tax=Hirschia TaxID=2723 RepID=C6XRD9_HIRBI|nr:polyprenyl synthetase family protein [Hirschia baltica]ACT58771.1 Trans-hexaprenyltranstransferase [Hirschia baltica ATCC 49814]
MTLIAELAEGSPLKKPPMDTLTELVAEDLSSVEALLSERAISSVATIPDMSAYLIGAGGKRLRPLITLAAAYAAGGKGSAPLHSLAAAVEYIHTATLLHDDVVDESDLRRGKKAAKMLWGNSASILVGDFLFARAFTLMVETRSLRILDILSNASCVIAEGEVKQLAAIGKADLPIEDYMDIVEAKTAALFEAAARAGALTVVAEGKESDGLAEYGRRLGRAFQLVDDALDYDGSTSVIGKSVGDDFREGKLTLPVLLAREHGDADARAFWDRAMDVSKQTEADLDIAIDYIRKADTVKATLDAARDEVAKAKAALEVLPSSEYVDALADIADFVVDRAY